MDKRRQALRSIGIWRSLPSGKTELFPHECPLCEECYNKGTYGCPGCPLGDYNQGGLQWMKEDKRY